MELSYWEYKTWLSQVDFTVVGSGIVGLNCAIRLKQRFPKAKVLVLEKGILPQGASTKNAGFACFGSISEVLSDLNTHSEREVYQLVEQRWQGIQRLRGLLGDKNLGFQLWGGHELFLNSQEGLFDHCLTRLEDINRLLRPIFGDKPFQRTRNTFGFQQIASNYITHQFEGQIDTGKMMCKLLQLAQKSGVLVLNNVTVSSFQELGAKVAVETDRFVFDTRQLLVTTNGFASQLLEEKVTPARAQVLVTEPIENLPIKGTFHFDEGYYYFRNIDDRILFGGGRNLDFKGEETTNFGQTEGIQNQLEHYLKEVILPKQDVQIAQRWSGIMGVGQQKKPIIKQLSDRVYCGVRLGGMGVAIGTAVGSDLADLV